MLASDVYEVVRPIQRWDRDPSEFWGAIRRIEAELLYDPRRHAARLSEPGQPVRIPLAHAGLSPEIRAGVLRLLPQLHQILRGLEYQLEKYGQDGLLRLEYYLDFFECAEQMIDLADFRIEEDADQATRSVQIDALSRAMLLKSELVLIVGQFELLRQEYLARRRKSRTTSRFNAAA